MYIYNVCDKTQFPTTVRVVCEEHNKVNLATIKTFFELV